MLQSIIKLTRFDKPIGSLLLLWPTLSALYLASHTEPSIRLLCVFALGVFLTRSAGCVINDIFDRRYDKHVARTANRPLASGELSVKSAIIILFVLIGLAFVLAITNLNLQTVLLTVPALFIFITYPLMKRFFKVPQAYLGIAFSMGILMAFTELDGNIGYIGWIYFLANLFWVLGYDTVYALSDINDDKLIKINSSAITFGRFVTFYIGLFYSLFIILLIIIGSYLHYGVKYYFFIFMMFLLLYVQVVNVYHKRNYLKMFYLNNWVGVLMFVGIFLSNN